MGTWGGYLEPASGGLESMLHGQPAVQPGLRYFSEPHFHDLTNRKSNT